MDSNRGLAGHAARLLGAGAPTLDAAPGGKAVELLAGQVADALGVARPAGERTLSAQDNLPLRLLLEERRLLGTDAQVGAIDEALRRGTLILAARGGPGRIAAAAGGFSVMLAAGATAPLCVFTHDAALRHHAGEQPVTAWVTESLRIWQFALLVLRREVVIDPGSPTELHLGLSRLQRLLA